MDCANVVKCTDVNALPPGVVGLHESSLANCQRQSNADIWGMCDELAALHAANRTGELKRKQQVYGVKFIDGGLLFCDRIREVHFPIDSYLRDWMHTIVSGGVANTHCWFIVEALKNTVNIPLAVLRDFTITCILPHKYGKVSETWLNQKRFHAEDRSLHSFASYMLHIVPIIAMLLTDYVDGVAGAQEMKPHIACVMLLANILGLISMGADSAVPFVDLLAEWIVKHHEMFVELYAPSACKPKFHHMLHLPELYRRLRKVISCFTAERKHRSVKRKALHVFRHIEVTVLRDVINDHFEHIIEGHSLYQKIFLVRPRVVDVSPSLTLLRSSTIVLVCGMIKEDDVVYVEGGQIVKIIGFWQCSGLVDDRDASAIIVAHCAGLKKATTGVHHYMYSSSVELIVDAMMYRNIGDNRIRVWLPFAARMR